MASIRKLSGNKWLCEVRRVRPKFYESKRFDSEHDAIQWGIDRERQLNLHKASPSKKTLLDAMESYRIDVAPKHKGARWEDIRLTALSRYSIVHHQLDDLTREDFQAWVDERLEEVSAATVRREYQLWRSVMKYARVKLKWTHSNPLTDIDLPKKPKDRDRLISDEEIELICTSLSYKPYQKVITPRHSIGAAFLLAIETAMRQGEIWSIEDKDLRLDKAYLKLYDTKNGDSRDVPLSKKAIRLIKSFPDYNKGKLIKNITQATAGTLFRRACQLAGIENLKFHDTRHEAITRLAKKLNILELARMVGHKDVRSLQIYYNATAAELAKRLG